MREGEREEGERERKGRGRKERKKKNRPTQKQINIPYTCSGSGLCTTINHARTRASEIDPARVLRLPDDIAFDVS